MADVVYLEPHERMTTKQALGAADNIQWEDIIICGYSEGEFTVLSSHMPREAALWIVEHLKLHALGRL